MVILIEKYWLVTKYLRYYAANLKVLRNLLRRFVPPTLFTLLVMFFCSQLSVSIIYVISLQALSTKVFISICLENLLFYVGGRNVELHRILL